jgi:polyribonucleotide nucleotidyltransferase
MDFKVAGTKDYVTALQLDTKLSGLPAEVLSGALKQALEARLFILDKMGEVLPAPRERLSPTAPRVESMQVPVDKIGEIIGPKGKRINEIIAVTGADIDIQDDGTVFIGSKEGEGAEKAKQMIDEILNPRIPEIGERFQGKVVKTTDFGAFVNILPGTDGLVHISELRRDGKRVESVEDVLHVGDDVEVVVVKLEPGIKLKIGLRPIWPGEEPPSVEQLKAEAEERDKRPSRPRGDRPRSGDRDRDRRPRREHRDG